MSNNPKEESEVLLGEVLPFAEKLLMEKSEFFPFAFVMLVGGQVEMVATYDGDEQPESQKVIDALNKVFSVGVKNNKYKATALTYMTSITDSETGNKNDAICVNLDHIENYSIRVYYPYTLKSKFLSRQNKLELLDPIAIKGDYLIFAK